MRRINKKYTPTIADELKDVYDLFIEVMENPQRRGYIALISKLKPVSKPPINLKLFHKKYCIDLKIKGIINEILDIIKFE